MDLEGMQLTYSSNASDETGLYPKSTLVKGKCIDGYVLFHPNQSNARPIRKKCRRNGAWVGRGDDVKCELITCPSLQESGFLSELVNVLPGSCSGGVGGNGNGSIKIPVKTKCRFSCVDQSRYKLIGSKIARCTKTSEWKLKGGPPKCTERHRYKKKAKKDRRKRLKKKQRPKLNIKIHSDNGRQSDVDVAKEYTSTIPEEVRYIYWKTFSSLIVKFNV